MSDLLAPVEAGATYEITADIEYRAVPPTFAATALAARWLRWAFFTPASIRRRRERLSRVHSEYHRRRR